MELNYMVSFVQRPKQLFFTITIISGLLASLSILIDSYAITKFNLSSSIFGIYSMLIGIITGFFFLVILSVVKISTLSETKRPLGAIFDPEFRGLILPTKEWKQILTYIGISGLVAGFNVFMYFMVLDLVDPSLLQPLGQFVTLYLLVFEIVFVDKELPALVEFLAIMNVTFGGILLTLSGDISGDIILGALLVLGPMNVLQIIIAYYNKKARSTPSTAGGRRMDALNIRLYFVIIMGITVIVLNLPFLFLEGFESLFGSLQYILPFALLTMVFTFFSYILYIRSLSMGKMSTVSAVRSISIVFSIVFTLLISIFDPQAFNISTSLVQWIFKGIGIIMVVAAIISLSISEVRTYIFIKCKVGWVLPVFEQLKRTKGIASLHQISGKYDLLCFVNLKTLGKVNSLLSKRIETQEGIEETYTVTILQQWERF